MSDFNIEECNGIIAELSEGATDNSIRDCIRAYDPSKPTEAIKKSLRKFHVETLFSTLEYLTPGQNLLKAKKEILLDSVITKIKNYFPDFCQICENKYQIKLAEKHFLSCQCCGQEVHKPCYFDLLAKMNLLDENGEPSQLLFKIPGICFLCGSCKSDVISNDIKPPEEIFTSVNQFNEDENDNENNTEFQKQNISVHENENEHQLIPSPRNHPIQEKVNNINNDANNLKTCFNYIKGLCKHGIKGKNCAYNHPKACKKLLNHGTRRNVGCNEGKHCVFFHPKMCFNSLSKGECFHRQCKFVHVKGTRRERKLNVRQDRNNQNNRNIFDHRYLHEKRYEKSHESTNIANGETRNDHNKTNFLLLMDNLKKDIIGELDMKLAKILSIQQQFPPPRPYQQQFQPTRPINVSHQQQFQPTRPINVSHQQQFQPTRPINVSQEPWNNNM